jgi:aryl-alcohol dehydrogenase-like predicted oxidoreductase
MRTVAFDGGGLGISRLGFGCAPVMGKVGKRQALDAMACAFDLGVTHFDIARSYGFGDAEAVLGEFIRGRRDRVTVASKFGIVPPVLSRLQRLARPVVRPLLKGLAPFRQKVRNASAGLLAARCFDLAYARQCLETTLRNLGTERLDIYLLHEPDLDTLSGESELRGFLDDSVRAGRIRAWGMGHPHAHGAVATDGGGRVLQFEAPASSEDGWVPSSEEPRFLFATRPLGGGALARGGQLGLDPLQFAMAWAGAAVGEHGAIVAGMFDRKHIAQNVQAIEHCDRQRGTLASALEAAGFAIRSYRTT